MPRRSFLNSSGQNFLSVVLRSSFRIVSISVSCLLPFSHFSFTIIFHFISCIDLIKSTTPRAQVQTILLFLNDSSPLGSPFIDHTILITESKTISYFKIARGYSFFWDYFWLMIQNSANQSVNYCFLQVRNKTVQTILFSWINKHQYLMIFSSLGWSCALKCIR